MTLESRLISVERKQDQILRLLKSSSKSEKWISEDQAMELTGLSKKSLQRYRNGDNPKIKKFRTRKSGRGIQYDKSELIQLFDLTEK